MQSETDIVDRIRDKLQRWENRLDEQREARDEAQGIKLKQVDLEITIIEQICDDLSELLDGFLTKTDTDSGIAIFDREGFVWMSNHPNPVDAFEEFDREVGIGSFGESLNLVSKKYTFFEIPEHDLPRWEEASEDDHPDPNGLRSVSL